MEHELYPHIFTPIKIGGKVFKNRIWTAPAGTHKLCGDDPFPNQYVTAHHAAEARGGAAVITLGGQIINFTDEARQRSVHDRYSIFLPRYHRFWQMWNDTMHTYDTKTSIELMFFALGGKGRNGDPIAYTVNTPPRERRQMETRIERDQLEFIASKYGDAAEAAVECGFDMVLLHFAHGFMISQFLSHRLNQRDDEFGGQSVENRCRFGDMLINAIRKRVGDKLLIEVRLSGSEHHPDGYDANGCAEIVKHFQDRIDIAHISSMGIGAGPPTNIDHELAEKLNGEGYNIKYAATIKSDPCVKIPVLTVGGYESAEVIESVLAEGKCDIVAMASAMIADPERVNKFRDGKADEAVPCIRCRYCGGYETQPYFGCTVNPVAGREYRLPLLTRGSGLQKKVAVVGGGPAGMQAAFAAAERGHDVTLYEKSAELGGLLKYTDLMSFKREVRNFVDYQRRMVVRRGVKVLLNTEATPELLAGEGYDAVIAAVGGAPAIPPLPIAEGGVVENTFTFFEKLKGGAFAANKVVVVGGGDVGSEIALHLAMDLGKDVTVIEKLDRVMNDIEDMMTRIVPVLLEQKAAVILNSSVKEIMSDSVVYTDEHGETKRLEADAVILATGVKPKQDYAESFRNAARDFVAVGDCIDPFNIRTATLSGWRAAVTL